MNFEVRANAGRKRRMLFGQILSGIMIVALLWFINWDVMAEHFKEEPDVYGLFVGMIVVFVLFFILFFYAKIVRAFS